MDLGEKIKAARTQKGFTQKELAENRTYRTYDSKESKIMK